MTPWWHYRQHGLARVGAPPSQLQRARASSGEAPHIHERARQHLEA
jgi:hypothetical protein